MEHLDPDTLALLALGESVDRSDASPHLAVCDACAATLDELRAAVRVGRSTIGLAALETPRPEVWARITADLQLTAPDPTSADPTSPDPSAPVSGAGRRRRVAWRRRPWIVALAAVLLVLAGVGTVLLVRQAAVPRVVAAATLSAFPGWAGSSGSATVEVHRGGTRTVTVHVQVHGPSSGSHEVWLMTGDLKAFVALGDLHGDTGVFTIPAGIDVTRYSVVDVSHETHDGDPGHAGDSIVRGTLTRP